MNDVDFPIVDAHHHLWNLDENYYPWLTDRITKRVCGEYAAIRRNYLVDDFLHDAETLPLIKSVHIQAEHDPSDPVRETRWLQAIADDDGRSRGFPHAIVAFADFSRDDVADVLDAHCAFPNVRGIRQMLHESLVDPSRPRPSLLENPSWQKNFGFIKRYPLSFELQAYYQQMPAACELVRAHPEVQFAICHMGQPVDRSVEGLARWRQALGKLAELPNTVAKISGVGMFDRHWTLESIRPLVFDIIDLFAPSRCMFGSNYPVDGMMSSYRRLWSSFASLIRDFSATEQQMMLAGNAERVYRI